MAVPLIGIIFLIGLIVLLFFIGVSRKNVNSSLAFIVFASVLMITTSMFVMNEGVQLNTVDGINPDTLSYDYQIVNYDVNNWDWIRVLTDSLFWGSFVGIIFGFAYNYNRSKANNVVDEWVV